jgi:hypothetical protein
MHGSHIPRNGVGSHYPAFPYHPLPYCINRQSSIAMRSWRHDNPLLTLNCNIRPLLHSCIICSPRYELLLLKIWCTFHNQSLFILTVSLKKIYRLMLCLYDRFRSLSLGSCLVYIYTLKMEALYSSETSGCLRTTRRYNPEHSTLPRF